jgi:DNA-binding NarL/FixJ family response regulator
VRLTVDLLLRKDKEFIKEGDRLSERQREVLQSLAEGKSMKEVAYELNVAADTVAKQKYRIMKSLNVKNTAELVQYAIRNHIIAA